MTLFKDPVESKICRGRHSKWGSLLMIRYKEGLFNRLTHQDRLRVVPTKGPRKPGRIITCLHRVSVSITFNTIPFSSHLDAIKERCVMQQLCTRPIPVPAPPIPSHPCSQTLIHPQSSWTAPYPSLSSPILPPLPYNVDPSLCNVYL